MTTEAVKKAEERLEEFEQFLSEYDHAGVQKLREAIADSGVAALEVPDLSVEKWLEVLEELGGEVYLHACESNHTGYDDDYEITWYLRHDGEAFIYGTEDTGELYRGEAAERQIRAVIDNHDVYAHPMDTYPIDKASDFVENNP